MPIDSATTASGIFTVNRILVVERNQLIPVGSLIAQWQVAPDAESKKQFAEKLQALLTNGVGDIAADAPDAVLHRQLTSLNGPLFAVVRKEVTGAENRYQLMARTPNLVLIQRCSANVRMVKRLMRQICVCRLRQ